VYKLSPHVKRGQEERGEGGLTYLGSPALDTDFDYDVRINEMENFEYLEERQISLFFDDEDFLHRLKERQFHVGIGSLSFSDTLLFRELGIQYIKVTREDIESFTMQVRMNMPVMLSTYPSLQMAEQFWDAKKAPKFKDFTYRFNFFLQYQYNKYLRKGRMDQLKTIIKPKFHKHIDDWDQEHALFLAEGANVDALQSVMLKPPNVQTIYPVIDWTPKNKHQLPEYFATGDNSTYVYVYVFDFDNKESAGYLEGDYIDGMLKQVKKKKRMPEE